MTNNKFIVLTNQWIDGQYENKYAVCWLCRKLATVVKIGNGYYCKTCLIEAIRAIDQAILGK